MPVKRRSTRKKHRGGFLRNLGSAVGQGVIQGLKQAPKDVLSSLRSKGSSYLQPTGSIANYAGNNIQNIIAGHHEELGTAVGKTLRTIKNTHFNNKINKKTIKAPLMLNPYYSKGLLQSKLAKNKSRNMFNSSINSQYIMKNISKNSKNINSSSKPISTSLEMH